MRVLAMTGALIVAIGTAAAQQQGPAQFSREWYQQFSGAYSDPLEPFRIVGNIHYVGAANVASYLIATPQGHFLIDTGMNEMHDGIKRSIGSERKGVRPHPLLQDPGAWTKQIENGEAAFEKRVAEEKARR